MKIKLLLTIASILLIVAIPTFAEAQTDIDRRTEAAQRENARLKAERLRALEEENSRLTREIQSIKAGTSSNETANSHAIPVPAPTPAPTPVPVPAPTPAPVNTGSASQQTAFSKCSPIDANASPELKDICSTAELITADRYHRTNPEFSLTMASATFLPDIVAAELVRFAQDPANGVNEVKFNTDVAAFLLGNERARIDKQSGADSKSAGTTSLAVKGGVPAFLSWATEHGGAESSRDGNTLTFRVNPIGLADTLKNWGGSNGFISPYNQEGLDQLFKRDDGLVRVLRNSSVGFSFDISRGVESPLFTGSKQQLSSVSFRYQFLNERDPLNPKYEKDWQTYRGKLQDFSNVTAKDVVPALLDFQPASTSFKNEDLNKWFTNLRTAILRILNDHAPTGEKDSRYIEEVRAVIESEVAKLPLDKLKTDTALINALNKLQNAQIDLGKEFDAVMKKVANGQVMTFEYTNYRNVNAPDLSNFRVIISRGFWDGADLTFNGSLTMYNRKPVQANPLIRVQRVRDFDFTLQADFPIKSFFNPTNATETSVDRLLNPSVFGIPVLTFAGKYQRLQSDAAMADGLVAPNTRGDIAYGQVKLTIPLNINGLSFKLPFSMTFANRSDLVKEKEVRGNFGFTLDIDPFFNMLKNNLAGGLFR